MYWNYMMEFPAHRDLSNSAKEKALRCYLIGEFSLSQYRSTIYIHSLDSLRLGSEFHALFLPEQIRDFLDVLDKYTQPSQNDEPAGGLPSLASSRNALVYWILWNVGGCTTLLIIGVNNSVFSSTSPEEHRDIENEEAKFILFFY